jgi:hypothetical protein
MKFWVFVLLTLTTVGYAQSTATKPRVDFATYLSGSSETEINAVTVDSAGYVYVAGRTWAADFPTTAGAYIRTPSQHCDQSGCGPYSGFAAKLSRDGRDLIYSTFLKGLGPSSIVVDGQGHAYISGDAVATDFVGTPGTIATKCSGINSQICNWVTELNATGSDVIFSTLLNGSVHCMYYEDLAINSKGEIYVAGGAFTSQACPTTANALRRTVATNTTAVLVMKLSANASTIIYSTFVSGAKPSDTFGGLAVDRNDHAIVAGETGSGPFPTSQSAYQRTAKNGAASAFVAKLSSDGSKLLASTLIGGSTAPSLGSDVAVDSDLNVYVTGVSYASDFPTTSGAYRRQHDPNNCEGPCSDVFLTKMPPDFGSLQYSTLFGVAGEDAPPNLAIDAVGHAYLAGSAAGGLPLVKAIQSGFGQIYLTKFSTGGNQLLFSSYLTGTNQFEGYTTKLAVDIAGNAYIGGFTRSKTFVTTSGAYQPANLSSDTAGIAMKVNLPPCTLSSTIPSVTICAPSAGASAKSPVVISAGATDDHSISAMSTYLDGVKVFTINGNSHFETKIPMSSGSHKITVKAWDTAGRIVSKSETITVP